ncbi:uncharacterized protein METZ01_LOCUS293188, partial [marine metagenome]
VGYWRLRLFNASSPKSVGMKMYNKRQSGAEKRGKEPLASNQVVGGSNLSGRAKVINDLAHFRKLESSHKSPILPQK